MNAEILHILQQPRRRNHAVAMYSLPEAGGFTVIVQDLAEQKEALSEFWFHPFGRTEQPFVVLRPDALLEVSSGELESDRAWLQAPDYWPLTGERELPQTTFEQYRGAILSAQEKFAAGELEKVILSRVIHAPLSSAFHPVFFACRLKKQYPGAFISYISTPFSGTWIGASPEVLLRRSGNKISTISLAGTRLGTEDTQWTEKEYHEQEIVTGYIRNILSGELFSGLEIEGPHEKSIGHLVHLQTVFNAFLRRPAGRDELLSIVRSLHPTPAVGGLPRNKAIDAIRELEKHARRYYAGFAGPVGNGEEASLFVNLRCMALSADTAFLLSGAGITAGSDPEKEWDETTNKANILMNLLRAETNPG